MRCVSSQTVFINRKSGEIRALWFLMMTYQNNNNKNDCLTQPQDGPGLNAGCELPVSGSKMLHILDNLLHKFQLVQQFLQSKIIYQLWPYDEWTENC